MNRRPQPSLDDESASGAVTFSVLALALAALIVHAATYLPFFADDAFISLRYARRLLDGGGLTWNDGEYVEGYSNLLWILACAALGALGVDLVHAARCLGLLGVAAALGAVVYAHPPTRFARALPAFAGTLSLSLAGPIGVWALGGMEQPLLAGLLAWALVLGYPLVERSEPPRPVEVFIPGLLLALICWTRPDGALLTAGACCGVLAARGLNRPALRIAAGLSVVPIVFYLGQLGFRLAYYGEWVPNPALAKLAFTQNRLRAGLGYIAGGAISLSPTLVLALGACAVAWRDPALRRRARFLGAPLVLWSAYVFLIGGDNFPARRHLVPLIVILSLLMAQALETTQRRGVKGAWSWGVALVLLGALLVTQQVDGVCRRARRELWEWDGEVVGRLLRRAFGEKRPLLAVDPAGCLPYFSGLPALDMLGINDSYLARHPPADFGRGWVGHELGNGAYVLGREPSLVLFCLPRGGPRPCFRSGREMIADPRFYSRYRLITFEGREPHLVRSRIWARVEGGPIGIRRSGRQVVVPGYLVSSNPGSVARLDAKGRMGASVTSGTPAMLMGLPLPPGSWDLEVDSSGAPVATEIRISGRPEPLAAGGSRVSFRLGEPSPGRIDLRIDSSRAGDAHVLQLIFERAATIR